jgi:transcriptional regulator with XRE-family HTH domain
VRVRNTPAENRGAWAAFAKAARESARDGRGISQSELARQLKVDRVTVWRWEAGQQRPEDPEIVARFADVLGIDRDEALAAARMRPGTEPPKEPTRERDDELADILTSDLPQAVKQELIETLLAERERDKQRRREHMQRLIRAEQRRAG